MRTILLLLLCACGSGVEQPKEPAPPQDFVKVTIDASPFCKIVDLKVCGNYCIPKEKTTCCIDRLPDGGFDVYWYEAENWPCVK